MLKITFAIAAALLATTAASAQDEPAPSRAGDVALLRDEIVWYDMSYPDDARDRALELTDALEARADELSNAGFELAVAEIVALSGNGHTQALAASWAARYPRLPVRFLIADDGLFIADTADDLAGWRGEQVDAVCGHSLSQIRDVWARYTTGRSGYRDQSLYYLIESPDMLAASGLCPNGVTLTLSGSGEQAIEAREGVFPPPQGIWQFLPQARLIELAEAGQIAGEPLYLGEPQATFRLVDLPERDAVYLQFRSNVDFSGQTDLRAEAAAAIDTLREMAPATVIVDQRFNLGGDLNTTRDLMQAIPDIVGEDGRVYAITTGRTFSAGISSVGYLKQAAGDQLTIVGAPVGDDLEFWAEGDPVRLPHSGMLILRATERHNYVTGCPEDDCHGSIRNNPIRVETLEPDLPVSANGAALLAGEDPYLDAIRADMTE